jgi:PAS domain S-box/diguanylate cyclase (GGDEF) domain
MGNRKGTAETSAADKEGDVAGLRRRVAELESQLREARDQHRWTMELSPQFPFVLDSKGRLVETSGSLSRLIGMTGRQADGTSWVSIVHPDDREDGVARWSEAAASGNTIDVEWRIRVADGSYRWFRTVAFPRFEGGKIANWYGTTDDIHDRKIAEAKLRESEERFRAMADDAPVMMWVSDASGATTFSNRMWVQTAGDHATKGFKGWLRSVHPGDRDAVFSTYATARAEHAPYRSEYRIITPDGDVRWVLDTARPRFTADGEFLGYVGTAVDITESKSDRERVDFLAHHDALTGLYNRMAFNHQLETALQAGSRGLSMLLLDLDGFKEINDTMGHPCGDALLRQIADRLSSAVPETRPARLGGDEFAFIYRSTSGGPTAVDMANRIIGCIADPFHVNGADLRVGGSVGVARAGSGTAAEDLFKMADIALYRAKAEGRGVVRVFENRMRREIEARQELRNDLEQAVARGEFEVHYQPQVDLHTGRVSGLEALVRWRHPRKGMVSPAEFIPVAEETGTIHAIGRFVLEQACLDAAKWPADVTVAVNLSPLQFRSLGLPLAVAHALGQAGLVPSRLQVEITETVLLNDSEQNLATLQALRDLGVSMAMDDFGTGYSSLGYLRNFRFDKVKIDRSFVGDIGVAANHSCDIIRAVTSMCRSLGLTVTAEGVETREQLEWLRAEGCHQIQGFLVSRPVPAHEVAALLDGHLPSMYGADRQAVAARIALHDAAVA